jgi:hypothetical protein
MSNKPAKFKYIDSKNFFNDYLPEIKNVKHKIRGKNGRGNPIEFSTEELKQIDKAIMKMAKDAVKS